MNRFPSGTRFWKGRGDRVDMEQACQNLGVEVGKLFFGSHAGRGIVQPADSVEYKMQRVIFELLLECRQPVGLVDAENQRPVVKIGTVRFLSADTHHVVWPFAGQQGIDHGLAE